MTPLDVVVLTGFLGSGKTTLLRDHLARPEAAGTAVIVNEAGEIGLDGAVLREGRGGVNLAMLANGCICCQAGNDLAATVYALLDAAPVQRIVLETSGLSKPGPVLRQLGGVPGVPMRVSVLATFDAVRGGKVAAFAEAAAQWAAAQRIVATRMDGLAPVLQAGVAAEIAALNPLAEIVATGKRDEAVAAAFAPLPPMGALPEIAATAAHPRIAVRLARPARALSYDELAAWLDNLAGALGERLLRLKGVVQVQGGPPLLVQSVGTLFSPPRPFPQVEGTGFLVVIGLDVTAAELEAVAPPGMFRFPRQALRAEGIQTPNQ